MKKYLFALLFCLLAASVFAQDKVYKKTLPSSKVELSGSAAYYFEVEENSCVIRATVDVFKNPDGSELKRVAYWGELILVKTKEFDLDKYLKFSPLQMDKHGNYKPLEINGYVLIVCDAEKKQLDDKDQYYYAKALTDLLIMEPVGNKCKIYFKELVDYKEPKSFLMALDQIVLAKLDLRSVVYY